MESSEQANQAMDVVLVVFDAFLKEKIQFAEMQRFPFSEISKEAITGLMEVLPIEKIGVISNMESVYGGFELLPTIKALGNVLSMQFNLGDNENEYRPLTDSLAIFTSDTLKESIDKTIKKAKFVDKTCLNGDVRQLIIQDKFLQRYFFKKYNKTVNPQQYFLYHRDSPPTLKEINETFKEGWIIKPTEKARSMGVTTNQFNNDEELQNFLRENEVDYFLIESFINAPMKKQIEQEERTFQTVHRLYVMYENNNAHVLAVRVKPAVVSQEQPGNSNEKNICTGADGEIKREDFTLEEYQATFGSSDLLFSEENKKLLQETMRAIAEVDGYALLKEILKNGSKIEKQYILDILKEPHPDFLNPPLISSYTQEFRNFIGDLLKDPDIGIWLQTDHQDYLRSQESVPQPTSYLTLIHSLRCEMQYKEQKIQKIEETDFYGGSFQGTLEMYIKAEDLIGKAAINDFVILHDSGSLQYFAWIKNKNDHLLPVMLPNPWDFSILVEKNKMKPYIIETHKHSLSQKD